MKHSPGPWEVRNYKTDGIERKNRICSIDYKNRYILVIADCDQTGQEEINTANATLMANAPELYRALLEMTNEFEYQYDGANNFSGLFEKERIRLITQARKALAKVEGRK